MSGGNYLSPEMEVPDTMDVSMDQPENLLFTWNSMFGNRHFGEGDDLVLGNKGTILRNEMDQVRYVPESKEEAREATEAAKPAEKAPDLISSGDTTDTHMQNFLDCVQSRQEPNAPFEIGFRSAIACQMAIASYRQGRTVSWDEKREEIV
jgi:predicted dehydrogenase